MKFSILVICSLVFPTILTAQLPFTIDAPAGVYDFNIDNAGNRIIVGSLNTNSTNDFDPSNEVFQLTSLISGISGFVASYDRSGALKYAFHISDEDIFPNVQNYLIESDADNNIYIYGVLTGKADFDPSSNVFELSAANVLQTISFLASYDKDGQFRFAFSLPFIMDNILSTNIINNNFINKVLSVDNTGNSYLLISPSFSGTYDLDPGSGQYLISFGKYIVSYDSNGNFRFAYRVPTNTIDIGTNGKREYFIIGLLNESIDEDFDFDPSDAVVKLPNIINSSFFFASYTSEGKLNFVKDIKGPNAVPIAITGTSSGDIVIAGKMFGVIDFDPSVDNFN